jgi:hypothetical protein
MKRIGAFDAAVPVDEEQAPYDGQEVRCVCVCVCIVPRGFVDGANMGNVNAVLCNVGSVRNISVCL